MHFTKVIQDDGYYECLASINPGQTPFMRVRAVRVFGDCYEPLVRDLLTGHAQSATDKRFAKPHDAIKYAMGMAVSYVSNRMREYKPPRNVFMP